MIKTIKTRKTSLFNILYELQFLFSEGFISPSTSMTLLQDPVITNTLEDHTNIIKENSNTLPRARWNNNRKSRLPQSRQGTIIIEGNILMEVKMEVT